MNLQSASPSVSSGGSARDDSKAVKRVDALRADKNCKISYRYLQPHESKIGNCGTLLNMGWPSATNPSTMLPCLFPLAHSI